MIKNVFLVYISFTFFYHVSTGQNIYTYAGTGTSASSGDGGPAISANIDGPSSVFIDGAGNCYITDIGCRVRKVNSTGLINTIAGGCTGSNGDGGLATTACLWIPKGFFMDGASNSYIADANNNRVRKIDNSGVITTIAGTGVANYSGDGGLAVSANIDYHIDVSLDAAGNIYIADANNNRIRKISPTGTITTIAGTGGSSYVGDGGLATLAELSFPSAVKADPTGNVFIADYGHHCIRKINSSGVISTIAGTGIAGHSGDGGLATLAQLNSPTDLVLDGSGNIFFTELPGYVRKISTSGTITTIAGTGISGYSGDGGPAILAQFKNLHGLALDASGNIYVADMLNYRVRVICMSSCLMKVEENSVLNNFKVHPNPTSGNLFLISDHFQNSEIQILNCIGQTVLETEFKDQIDVSQLSPGAYIIRLSSDGKTIRSKFIKQ